MSTFKSVAFLLFVPVVAANEFAKNTILVPNVGPLPQTQQLKLLNTLMPKVFRKNLQNQQNQLNILTKTEKSAKSAKSAKIHKTAGGSSKPSRSVPKWSSWLPSSSLCAQQGAQMEKDLHI